MNLQEEVDRYMAAVYSEKLCAEQYEDVRRAFIAGVHLAACALRAESKSAQAIVAITSEFAKTVGTKRN